MYETEEYAGIFDDRIVQLAVEAAPDVLRRELCMIPLVHRIEVVEIVNEVRRRTYFASLQQ